MSSASQVTGSNKFSNIEIVSYFIFAWHILLFVISIRTQKPIYPLKFNFGYDHAILLEASRNFVAGMNPYQFSRFVAPPMSILLNVPLIHLNYTDAAHIFFVFNTLCILFSLFLLTKTFALRKRDIVLFVLATLSSYPCIMVMERGNLDGIMFLLVSSALYARNRKYVPGTWIGLASTLKVYPLIFIVPLFMSKKWKAVIAFIIVVLISILLFSDLYVSFWRNQIIRIDDMGLRDNISSIAPLWYFSTKLGFSGLLGMSVGALLVMLAGLFCVYYDFVLLKHINDGEKIFLFTSYAVFCLNFPALVYLYTAMLMFILLAASNSNDLRMSRYYRYWLALCLAFLFFPAQSIAVTLGIEDRDHVLHFVPEIGSAMLLLYAVMVRRNILHTIRRSPKVPPVAASVAS